MANKLIGDIMVEMGIASRELVTECLNKQTDVNHKGEVRIPLGVLLMKTGFVSQEQLDKALEKQAKYKLHS